MTHRCSWVGTDPLLKTYHDDIWGRPVQDPEKLFQALSLEIFQAGLSWRTILGRVGALNCAYENFNIAAVAQFPQQKLTRLAKDPQLIRHPKKVLAIHNNAQKVLAHWPETTAFAAYLWTFALPQTASPKDKQQQARLAEKSLKRRGFRFLGPTILTSFFEAVGIFPAHEPTCDWAN